MLLTLNGKMAATQHYKNGSQDCLSILYIKRFTPDLSINYTLPAIGDKPGDYTYSPDYKVFLNVARFEKGHKSGDEPNGIWSNDSDLFKVFGLDENASDEEKDVHFQLVTKGNLHWISKYEADYDYEIRFRIASNTGNQPTALSK